MGPGVLVSWPHSCKVLGHMMGVKTAVSLCILRTTHRFSILFPFCISDPPAEARPVGDVFPLISRPEALWPQWIGAVSGLVYAKLPLTPFSVL